MTDEQSIRDELIGLRLASYSKTMSDGYPSSIIRSNEEAADILLASPVIRRIQAETLRKVAEMFPDNEHDVGVKPAAVRKWLSARAERIERGETA